MTPSPNPVTRDQALQIIANPQAFADRPSLIALARMVAASALGHTITQRRRATPRTALPQPRLTVIQGGRAADADARQAYRLGDAPTRV